VRAVITPAAWSLSARRRQGLVPGRPAVPLELLVVVPLPAMASQVMPWTRGLLRLVATCASEGARTTRIAWRGREPLSVLTNFRETAMTSDVVIGGRSQRVPVAVAPRAPRRRLAGTATKHTLWRERPRRAVYRRRCKAVML